MNLFDLFEGAIDDLEARRIQDLEAKMDDLTARAKSTDDPKVKLALRHEFAKCKAERDSYYKLNLDEADRDTEKTIRSVMSQVFVDGGGGNLSYMIELKAPTMTKLREKYHDDLEAMLTQASPKELAQAAQELKAMTDTVEEDVDTNYTYTVFIDGTKEGTYGSKEEAKAVVKRKKEQAPGREYTIRPKSRTSMSSIKKFQRNRDRNLDEDDLVTAEGFAIDAKPDERDLDPANKWKIMVRQIIADYIKNPQGLYYIAKQKGPTSAEATAYNQIMHPGSKIPLPPGAVTIEGFQDFNKVEPYAVCLAGKPVKKFDYYEQARKFHDNWKQKLYREGNKEKADKITLMPLNLDEGTRGSAIKQGQQDAAKGLSKQQNPYYKSVNGKTPPAAYDWEAGWDDAKATGKIPQPSVAEGAETPSGQPTEIDPGKYYVWAWDSAVVVYGKYDTVRDAEHNLPAIEQAAIKRVGSYVRGAFKVASGRSLLAKYFDKQGVSEAGDRVDPILIKALNRMPDGLATHGQVLDAAYDAYAMELGRMAMKSNYGTTNAYIPQLLDLYKQKHGLTFNEAANPAQQAAIAINMKKHHQKPKVDEGDYDEMYSPEAIKIGNYFIKQFNLTNEIDQQLAIEITDNVIESGETELAVIKKEVIKYLRKSGTIVKNSKQGMSEDEQIDGMARGEVKEIIRNASTIQQALDQDISLDGWMYSYVTTSNDHLNSVAEQIGNPDIEEAGMDWAAHKSTGPKFSGYLKGTDPAPTEFGNKSVGGMEEGIDGNMTVRSNPLSQPLRKRNYVAKNAQSSGAGKHNNNLKAAAARGQVKHKAKAFELSEDDQVLQLQKQLIAKGAKINADGIMGPQTQAAMKQFGANTAQPQPAQAPTSGTDKEIQSIVKVGSGFNIVKTADGELQRRTGARNWRNNNPGNIQYSPYAKSKGAVGSDGRYAIFPTLDTGMSAKKDLLFGSAYNKLSIAQAITKYAPPHENNTEGYIQAVVAATKATPDTIMSQLNDNQKQQLLNAVTRQEGFKVGSIQVVPDAEAMAEGWKSTVAGAALAGAAALGAGGAHAGGISTTGQGFSIDDQMALNQQMQQRQQQQYNQAQQQKPQAPTAQKDLSAFGTEYLQKVADGQGGRAMVSVADAKAELAARANGTSQQAPAPVKASDSNNGQYKSLGDYYKANPGVRESSDNFLSWAVRNGYNFTKDPAIYESARIEYKALVESKKKTLNEAKGLGKRVRVVSGPASGQTGTIGEVRNGAYQGAPKYYTVDLDNGGHVQVRKEALRLITSEIDESLKDNEYFVWTVYFDNGTSKRIKVKSDEFDPYAYYARKNQVVVNVDYDWSIHQ
jgi:hypothetical protein